MLRDDVYEQNDQNSDYCRPFEHFDPGPHARGLSSENRPIQQQFELCPLFDCLSTCNSQDTRIKVEQDEHKVYRVPGEGGVQAGMPQLQKVSLLLLPKGGKRAEESAS